MDRGRIRRLGILSFWSNSKITLKMEGKSQFQNPHRSAKHYRGSHSHLELHSPPGSKKCTIEHTSPYYITEGAQLPSAPIQKYLEFHPLIRQIPLWNFSELSLANSHIFRLPNNHFSHPRNITPLEMDHIPKELFKKLVEEVCEDRIEKLMEKVCEDRESIDQVRNEAVIGMEKIALLFKEIMQKIPVSKIPTTTPIQLIDVVLEASKNMKILRYISNQ